MTNPTAPSVLLPPPSSPRRRYRRLVLLTMVTVLVVVALILVLWSWIALTYVYASGQHTGYIRGFTRSGWLCKTWEGELMTTPTPAAPSQLFAFTVRGDSLATILQNAQDKQVTLSYSQHMPSPSSCLGETRYFVDSVTIRTP